MHIHTIQPIRPPSQPPPIPASPMRFGAEPAVANPQQAINALLKPIVYWKLTFGPVTGRDMLCRLRNNFDFHEAARLADEAMFKRRPKDDAENSLYLEPRYTGSNALQAMPGLSLKNAKKALAVIHQFSTLGLITTQPNPDKHMVYHPGSGTYAVGKGNLAEYLEKLKQQGQPGTDLGPDFIVTAFTAKGKAETDTQTWKYNTKGAWQSLFIIPKLIVTLGKIMFLGRDDDGHFPLELRRRWQDKVLEKHLAAIGTDDSDDAKANRYLHTYLPTRPYDRVLPLQVLLRLHQLMQTKGLKILAEPFYSDKLNEYLWTEPVFDPKLGKAVLQPVDRAKKRSQFSNRIYHHFPNTASLGLYSDFYHDWAGRLPNPGEVFDTLHKLGLITTPKRKAIAVMHRGSPSFPRVPEKVVVRKVFARVTERGQRLLKASPLYKQFAKDQPSPYHLGLGMGKKLPRLFTRYKDPKTKIPKDMLV